MESTTVYFEKPGPDNTEQALEIAAKRANELGIKTVLIASTGGATGQRALELFKGQRVIVVSHTHGFKAADESEMEASARAELEAKGATVLTAAHAFGGVSRAIRRKLETSTGGDIIANTLRTLGQGMKVACEIVLMAADAGLVRTDETVICVGGSGRGADTVITCRPVNSDLYFDLRVQEILCKPHF